MERFRRLRTKIPFPRTETTADGDSVRACVRLLRRKAEHVREDVPSTGCLHPRAAQQIARSFYAPTERVASTMTLVPIGVRSYRSTADSFLVRMQPEETLCPMLSGSLVPWMR